jgi:pyridoxal phosphate enzyme (YggS family)
MAMNEELVIRIRDRYQEVMSQIAAASDRSGGHPVQLVVVSKRQSVETIRAAIAAGVTKLGENYAEEAVEKMLALGKSTVEWHMIGHVQSRKAEIVAKHFKMIHSLDSIKLADRLERFCSQEFLSLPVLLEVNVSGEESKFGFAAWENSKWTELVPQFEHLVQLPHLMVCGLMIMPPYSDDPEFGRPYFRKTKQLRDYLAGELGDRFFTELSMGTSSDYRTAVEEGATFVRVGQAILGSRSGHLEK